MGQECSSYINSCNLSRNNSLLSALMVFLVVVSSLRFSEARDGGSSTIQSRDYQQEREGDLLIVHDDGAPSPGGPQALHVTSVGGVPEWDANGYIIFCPCMGRFGNQMDHLLGGLAFAKAINRTMILPTMREDLASFRDFADWFQIEPLLEFHRVILGSDFMEHLADDGWPPEKRRGYCRLNPVTPGQCTMKRGIPQSGFWDYFNIDFVGSVNFELSDEVDFSIESEVKLLRGEWAEKFPAAEHPVLALQGVPASFPILPGNRFIQRFFKWTPALLGEAHRVKRKLFDGERYLGIHLRVGEDWDRVCKAAVGKASFYFASPQCKSSAHGTIFQDMCYPSVEKIMELTREAMVTFDLHHLYIASDTEPYKKEFGKALADLNVIVHHYNPLGPQMDLIILGEADFFIGNCISTFTSAIKRERDANDRPSTFWGFPI